MQLFYLTGGRREPLVGVVGALQFEVIVSRMRTEYGVAAEIEPTPYAAARWLADPGTRLPSLGGNTVAALDRQERRVLLFGSQWELDYFQRHHPAIQLLAESPV
jgi:peptide chain release factor 3